MNFASFTIISSVAVVSMLFAGNAVKPAPITANQQQQSFKTVQSPHSGKEFLIFGTRSSSTFAEARDICASSQARLAQPIPADIDFLGGFIESLDEPHWIGGIADSPFAVPCAAIYYGGAVAVPKPPSSSASPCDSLFNVICEPL